MNVKYLATSLPAVNSGNVTNVLTSDTLVPGVWVIYFSLRVVTNSGTSTISWIEADAAAQGTVPTNYPSSVSYGNSATQTTTTIGANNLFVSASGVLTLTNSQTISLKCYLSYTGADGSVVFYGGASFMTCTRIG